jgi:hypothetical protein
MLQATKALALEVTPAPCHGLLHLRALSHDPAAAYLLPPPPRSPSLAPPTIDLRPHTPSTTDLGIIRVMGVSNLVVGLRQP